MTPSPDFFLIGLERSGTHWVMALLNAHPDISAFPWLPFHAEEGKNNIGEVHLFDTLAGLDSEKYHDRFPRPFTDFLTKYNKVFADLVPLVDQLSRQELYAAFRERYNQYCQEQKGNKKIVGESTPAYVLYLDLVDMFYPEIKKICIIRDPKDRVVSWHFNQIRKGRKTDMIISDGFARDYAEERIKKEYESLLAYPGDIHCITYEQLSNNTAETIRGMIRYLGMEYTDEIIETMIREGDFKNLVAKDSGSGRERGEESVTSHFRKGIVGDWKNYLSESQVQMVQELVGGLQKQVFAKYHVIY